MASENPYVREAIDRAKRKESTRLDKSKRGNQLVTPLVTKGVTKREPYNGKRVRINLSLSRIEGNELSVKAKKRGLSVTTYATAVLRAKA